MGRLVVFCVCAVVLLGPVTALAPIGIPHHTGSLVSDPAADHLWSGSTSETERPENNTTRTATKPGAQFVGIIGAHREQHEGSVTEQSVEVQISGADSPEEKAKIVASIHHQNEQRLNELAERKQELQQAHQNGSITDSEYRARSAVLGVELRSVERTAIQLERVADDLSISILIAVGVELEAIHDVQTRARGLQGTELPVIAPSFTRVSNDSATGSPTSDDTESGNETDTGENLNTNVSTTVADAEMEVQTAREQVKQANQTIEGTLVSGTVTDLLEQAQHNLSIAEQKLVAARDAQEAENDQKAIDLANEAIGFARTATEQAEAAIEEATGE